MQRPRNRQDESAGGNLVDDLREAIATSELSRYEIAKRAEISASLLSVFVNGHRSLTLDTAAKIAEVLGLVLRPK